MYANARDMEDKPVMDVLITSFLFLSNVGLKNSKKYIRSFHVHRFFCSPSQSIHLNQDLFIFIQWMIVTLHLF